MAKLRRRPAYYRQKKGDEDLPETPHRKFVEVSFLFYSALDQFSFHCRKKGEVSPRRFVLYHGQGGGGGVTFLLFQLKGEERGIVSEGL